MLLSRAAGVDQMRRQSEQSIYSAPAAAAAQNSCMCGTRRGSAGGGLARAIACRGPSFGLLVPRWLGDACKHTGFPAVQARVATNLVSSTGRLQLGPMVQQASQRMRGDQFALAARVPQPLERHQVQAFGGCCAAWLRLIDLSKGAGAGAGDAWGLFTCRPSAARRQAAPRWRRSRCGPHGGASQLYRHAWHDSNMTTGGVFPCACTVTLPSERRCTPGLAIATGTRRRHQVLGESGQPACMSPVSPSACQMKR